MRPNSDYKIKMKFVIAFGKLEFNSKCSHLSQLNISSKILVSLIAISLLANDNTHTHTHTHTGGKGSENFSEIDPDLEKLNLVSF
jgi:hypothetical protein